MKLRRLLMASALALSFTVTAPAVAKADPISAAVVAFVGFTGTAAAVATFVINTALYAAGSWALGKAAQALGMNKSAVAERQAQVTSLSLGETPRELVIGIACTGGTLVDAFNFGGEYGTGTTTRCIALADHEVDALVGYYVDDQYYAWSGDGVQPGFGGRLSIEFKNARVDGWDAPLHVRQNGGWTLADRMVGITHVWIDTRFDDKVWTQGHPRFRFVLRGLKAYDARKDAALGYTGPNPHVWGDPSTYQFTQNAAVLRYAFQRGIYATGRHGQPEHLLSGRGLSAEEAPPERVIAAANVCDEVVDGEPRYRANGVISTAQTFIEVEEMFAAAMAGVIVSREGGVEVEPGQAKAAVVTITDADLVSGEAVSFSEFLPDTEGGRINTVVPRYVEPAQSWKDHGGPPRRVLVDIQEDGAPREMTLPLMLVTSGKQADRCAEIARLKARLERRATIVLPAEYGEIEEGDWIAWQSARYHDGATVRYRVTSFSLDEKWRMRLTLEEIASSVYGVPDPLEDKSEPPPPPVPVDALELFGVTAEAVTLAGATSAIPAIRYHWDAVDDAVVQIRAEVRKVGETTAASLMTDDVDAGELVMTNGVTPDQVLECRLTPIAASSTRPVVPSNWITVSTTTVKAGDINGDAPGLNQIKADIEAAFGDIFDVSELIGSTRADLEAADAALGSAIGSLDSRADTLETQTASLEANKASVSSLNAQITRIDDVVAVNASQALALVDLENNKVALSEYSTLKGEVTAARDGSSSLLGQIQNLKSVDLDLQTNKASVESVNALTGRTANTEADIIDLELAQAGESSARVEAINELAARSAHRPNLIDNPSGDADFRSWIKEGGPNSSILNDNLAGRIFVVTDYMVSRVYPSAAGDQHSLSYNASPVGGGGVRLQYLTSGGTVEGVNVPNTLGSIDERRRSSAPSTAPAGTTGFRLVVAPPAGASLPVWAIKVNFGAVATEFSDDYSATVLEASVTEQSLAIIDLENQQAIASWYKTADASGGKPVRLGLTSSSFGSFIALEAPFIYWGDNTVFDDATDTLQTTIGGFRRVLAFGAPFGASGNLLDWWGPSSVALGSMTTGNGLNGRMTTAPYVFDNAVSGTRRALVNAPDTSVGSSWVLMAQYTMGGVSAGPDGIIVAARFDVTTFLFLPSGGGVTDFYGEMQLREMAPDGSGSTVLSTKAFNSTTGDPSTSTTAAGSRTGEVRYQVWMRSTQPAETATIGGKVEFQAAPNG